MYEWDGMGIYKKKYDWKHEIQLLFLKRTIILIIFRYFVHSTENICHHQANIHCFYCDNAMVKLTPRGIWNQCMPHPGATIFFPEGIRIRTEVVPYAWPTWTMGDLNVSCYSHSRALQALQVIRTLSPPHFPWNTSLWVVGDNLHWSLLRLKDDRTFIDPQCAFVEIGN